jgi:hypothetical protein
MTSVLDRHRLDSDPDPTFYFDAADPYPTSKCTHVGNQNYFLLLFTAVTLDPDSDTNQIFGDKICKIKFIVGNFF